VWILLQGWVSTSNLTSIQLLVSFLPVTLTFHQPKKAYYNKLTTLSVAVIPVLYEQQGSFSNCASMARTQSTTVHEQFLLSILFSLQYW